MTLLLAAALLSPARNLDPAARLLPHTPVARPASDGGIATGDNYVSMIVQIDPDGGLEALAELGAVVFHSRGDMALVCIPLDRLESLDGIEVVRRASLSRRGRPNLDIARRATRVDAVAAGTESRLPYTGEGVIVGMSDIGFDPGHADFRGRVAGISHYEEQNALVTRIHDDDSLASWKTDSPVNYHATHVAGILAGGGDGTPYVGVAPGAKLYATTSTLHDVGILAGVEDIIKYAAFEGRPAVINLSLGSTLGPHDGTDLFCRYLDLCAAEVPVLLSAGNDGDASQGIMVRHTFTPDEPSFMVQLYDKIEWNAVNIIGHCDAWSNDDRPFDLKIRIYDALDRKFVYETDLISARSDATTVYYASDSELGRYFEGQIAVASELCPLNDRYNMMVYYDLRSTELLPVGTWSRYYVCMEMTGESGVHVDLAANGETLYFSPVASLASTVKSCTADLSISSLACGQNTIAVGSATTRDSAPLLAGGTASWASLYPRGSVSSFSAYGTLVDGRSLPHFCAPGAFVVSAASRYYMNALPEHRADINAEGDTPGHYFFADCGTSMASPHAAGVFALWLEADPTLTPAELLDIAVSTASTSGVDLADPRAGAGMIDAEAGLRVVLDRAGIELPPSLESPRVRRSGRCLEVIPGADPVDAITVYDLSGRLVDPESLPLSPVIVTVTTSSATYHFKI